MTSIDDMIKTPPDLYYKEIDSNVYKLLNVSAEELDNINTMLLDVQKNHWIDDAVGVQLDLIGSLFYQMGRWTGESDALFRIRLKGATGFIGGGTPEAIRKAAAGIIGCPEDDILVLDLLKLWHDPYTEFLFKLDGNVTDTMGKQTMVWTGASSYTTGKWGQAATNITDANYPTITHHNNFNGEFTVMGWFSLTSLATFCGILDKSTGTNMDWYLTVSTLGSVSAYLNLATTDCSVSTPNGTIVTGKKYFFALKYNNTTKKITIYIAEDGGILNSWESTAGAGARTTNVTSIKVGRRDGGSQFINTGWIDHLMWYMSPLSTETINEFYKYGLGRDHYAHFTILVVDLDLYTFSYANLVSEINKVRAAGCYFGGLVGHWIKENCIVSEAYNIELTGEQEMAIVIEDGNICHYADITYADSLNVICI